MRRRTQPHDLRTEIHPAVVKVMCLMIQRNVNRHSVVVLVPVTRGGGGAKPLVSGGAALKKTVVAGFLKISRFFLVVVGEKIKGERLFCW